MCSYKISGVFGCVSLVLSLLFPIIAHSDILGTVISVIDGDTIKLRVSSGKVIRVRMLGIDAPESDQEGGNESTIFLKKMVAGKFVQVKSFENDRYGRLLGKVLLGVEDINYNMVKFGQAWWYQRFQQSQAPADRVSYRDAETIARRDQVGLWSVNKPIAPWLYRQKHR